MVGVYNVISKYIIHQMLNSPNTCIFKRDFKFVRRQVMSPVVCFVFKPQRSDLLVCGDILSQGLGRCFMLILIAVEFADL
jgi:hypothetical protein